MEVKQTNTHTMLKRIVAPLTVWAVTKVLETPRVKKAVAKVDRKLYKQRRRVTSNAMRNRVWLAAGLAAIVTGVSLVARASKR